MATKRKTENTISKTIETISQKTKEVNESAISTTHQLLDTVFVKAEKWQDLLAQTLETGVAYCGVQQDRLLTKIEGFKAQYDKGENPFADFFSFKSTDIPAAPAEMLDKTVAKAKKAAKTAGSQTAKTQKAATKAVKRGTKQASQVVTKVTAKAQKATAKTTAAKTARPTSKNDLKQLKGIGPKMEGVLNAAGITTFAQLAAATPKQLEAILLSAGPRYKHFDTTEWTKQAKQLIK